MNLKSTELLIDFEFMGGKDNNDLYAFTVKCGRDKKSFESVKQFQRACYRIESGRRIALDYKTAEEIIGLSYENFRRTIIIPQGKFQEFLQLTDTERSKMLKEIFNLHKFDLQDRTSEIGNRNKQALSQVEGQLKEIGSVTGEQISKAKDDLSAESIKQVEIGDKLKLKQEEEKRLQLLSQLFEKLERQKNIVANFQKQTSGYERREATLQEYEMCVQHFRDVLEQEESIRQSLDKSSTALGLQKKTLQEHSIELDRKREHSERTKKEFEGREMLKREVDDLETIVTIRNLAGSVDALSKSVQSKESVVAEKAEMVTKLKETIRSTKAELGQKKKTLPDLKELSDIDKWFVSRANCLGLVSQAQENVQTLQADLKQLSIRKSEVISSKEIRKYLSKKQASLGFDKLAGILAQTKRDLKIAQRSCTDELRYKEVHLQLREYAKKLIPGAPCPVCGATEHPNITVGESVEKEVKALRRKSSQLESEIELLDGPIQDLGKLGVKYARVSDSLQIESDRHLKAQKRLDQHGEKFQWKGFDPTSEGKVQTEFKRAAKMQKDIEELEGRIERSAGTITECESERDLTKESLTSDKQELSAQVREQKTRMGQLKIKRLNDYESVTDDKIKGRIKELNKKYSDVERAYRDLEKQVNALSEETDTLKGQIKQGEKSINEGRHSHEKVLAVIDKRLSTTGITSVADVRNILQTEINGKQERKDINKFKEDIHTAAEKLRDLESDTLGKSYDKKAHARLSLELDSLSKTLNEESELVGQLKKKIKDLQVSLDKRLGLEKEQIKLKLRSENIEVLKSLFRGNGFVNYVSTVYLRAICYAANARFSQLTRQKLRLELTGENTFQVRDFMNDGKRRNVKTLSGGQLFQASLSLALAMGDQIQQLLSANQRFFFLDEGFGSLDKESLQTVFETLASLRKENRVVGIISHVDELQQEITTHLKVRNTEEEGTVIQTSW